MNRIFKDFIPCLLIATLILLCVPGLFGTHTVVHAASEVPKYQAPSNITLNMRSVKLVKGTSIRLKVQNLPAGHNISYSSSNTKIATVSSTGKIKARKKGETNVTVTVRCGSKTVRKLTCHVTVGPAAVSIVIPKSKITLTLGKKGYVNYIIKPSNSAEVPVFKSSNKKVAKVSKTGVITTHSAGKAVITATIANGKSDSLLVVVNKKPKKKS